MEYASIDGVADALLNHWLETTAAYDDEVGAQERIAVVGPTSQGRLTEVVSKPFVDFLIKKGFDADLIRSPSKDLLIENVLEHPKFQSIVVLPVSPGSAAKLTSIIEAGIVRKVDPLDSTTSTIPAYITIPQCMIENNRYVSSTLFAPFDDSSESDESAPTVQVALPALYLDAFRFESMRDENAGSENNHFLFDEYAGLGSAFLFRRGGTRKLLKALVQSSTSGVETISAASSEVNEIVKHNVNINIVNSSVGGVSAGTGDSRASGTVQTSIAGWAIDELADQVRVLVSKAIDAEDSGRVELERLLVNEDQIQTAEATELVAAIEEQLSTIVADPERKEQFKTWMKLRAQSISDNTVGSAIATSVLSWLGLG